MAAAAAVKEKLKPARSVQVRRAASRNFPEWLAPLLIYSAVIAAAFLCEYIPWRRHSEVVIVACVALGLMAPLWVSRSRSRQAVLTGLLGAFSAVTTVMCLWSVPFPKSFDLFATYRGVERWNGWFADPNTTGCILALAVLAGVALAFDATGPRKKAFRTHYILPSTLLLLFRLSQTYSRVAVVCLALGMVLFAVQRLRLGRLKLAAGCAGAITLLALFMMTREWGVESGFAPLRRIYSAMNPQDLSWIHRTYTMEGAVAMMLDKPLTGFGWKEALQWYSAFYAPFYLDETSSFLLNDFTRLGASFGVWALILAVALFAFLISRPIAPSLTLFTTLLAIMAAIQSLLLNPQLLIVLSLVTGTTLALRDQKLRMDAAGKLGLVILATIIGLPFLLRSEHTLRHRYFQASNGVETLELTPGSNSGGTVFLDGGGRPFSEIGREARQLGWRGLRTVVPLTRDRSLSSAAIGALAVVEASPVVMRTIPVATNTVSYSISSAASFSANTFAEALDQVTRQLKPRPISLLAPNQGKYPLAGMVAGATLLFVTGVFSILKSYRERGLTRPLHFGMAALLGASICFGVSAARPLAFDENARSAAWGAQMRRVRIPVEIFDPFVKSPTLAAGVDFGDRARLWQTFYAPTRAKSTAAVVDKLNRVLDEFFVEADATSQPCDHTIGGRVICRPEEFRNNIIAVLRSVGVPARLSEGGAEIWDGEWKQLSFTK